MRQRGPRRELAHWVLLCAAAEAVGLTAAAAAARAADRLVAGGVPWEVALAWVAVVGAGTVEALALALAETTMLRRTTPGLRAGRFIAATVLVAGATWAGASVPGLAGSAAPSQEGPSAGFLLLAGAALGVGAGGLLGAAQAATLPRAARPSQRRGVWVWANVAAWTPVMAVVMLGASAPAPDWGLPTLLAWAALVGASAGALLGLALGVLSPGEGRFRDRLVLRLLGSAPSGRRLGRSLLGIRVRGRRTGRTVELPVMYAAQPDGVLWVAVGGSAGKSWWRNLVAHPQVEVLQHGRWTPARAEPVRASDPRFGPALAVYVARWPRARLHEGDLMVRLEKTDVPAPADPAAGVCRERLRP